MCDCLPLPYFILLIFAMAETVRSSNITDFFPDINGNLTKITWAHAVNNHSYLMETLANDDIMMIEADVVLGTLVGNGVLMPIMCHPPGNKSDLSLQGFFFDIYNFNHNGTETNKKGVKLDFKSIAAFIASLSLIDNYVKKELFPIWINADILPGPINARTDPVEANEFLKHASFFTNSTLSIGWTTNYGPDVTKGSYDSNQTEAMIKAIRTNHVTQKITFPVRAGLAAQSIKTLMNLTDAVENSTLTIWSSEGDSVDVNSLRHLIAKMGVDRVYVDVPNDLMVKLRLNDLPSGSGKVNYSLWAFLGFVFANFVSRLRR